MFYIHHGLRNSILCVLFTLVFVSFAQAQDIAPGSAALTSQPDVVGADSLENTASKISGEVVAPGPQSEGEIIQKEQIKESSATASAPERPKSKRIPSLFFTYWQHQSILDALQSGEGSQGNANVSLTEEEKRIKEQEEMVKPANREVSLSGIVFVHDKDWTIWLNGMRVTPDAIPPEALDLKVFKTHIDLKWYDEYTNKIFPIRIRPHQRFNVDTRVFLPG